MPPFEFRGFITHLFEIGGKEFLASNP